MRLTAVLFFFAVVFLAEENASASAHRLDAGSLCVSERHWLIVIPDFELLKMRA